MHKIVILFVIIAAGIAGFLYWRQSQAVPFMVSGFIEADEIRVGSRVGGRIDKVIAKEGSKVATNDLLFELNPFDLRDQHAQAQATLASAQADLTRLKAGYRREEIEQTRAKRDQAKNTHDKLVAGPRKQQIEVAQAQLNDARAKLEFAESDFERMKRLQETQQAAPTEINLATKTLKTAQAELAAREAELSLLQEGTRKEEIAEAAAKLTQAEEALKLLEAGYRPEDVAKAQAEVNAAQARVAAIETQLHELQVVSPCNCLVETIDLQPGDMVNANAPTVSLLDLSNIWVRSYVPEVRLGEIHVGQEVPIRVDNFPNELFRAEIIFIASEGEFTPRNIQTPEERSKQVFRIKAAIKTGLDRLRVGMAADILFDREPTP